LRQFVLDASMAAAWLFVEQRNERNRGLLQSLESDSRALVPGFWSFEIANLVWTARRRGRVSELQATQYLMLLKTLPIEVEFEPLARIFDTVSSLAARYDITVYDAAYLELAIRDSLPLATVDTELARAAQQAGVAVI
jgi:predicted nucleic acid-binding protein